MKKELFFELVVIMMITMQSLCLVSCSSNDENNESLTSLLIGTWRGYDENDGNFLTVTFRSNGTGYLIEEKSNGKDDVANFQWIFDEETMILRMKFDNESKWESEKVEVLTSKKMIIYSIVFTKK